MCRRLSGLVFLKIVVKLHANTVLMSMFKKSLNCRTSRHSHDSTQGASSQVTVGFHCVGIVCDCVLCEKKHIWIRKWHQIVLTCWWVGNKETKQKVLLLTVETNIEDCGWIEFFFSNATSFVQELKQNLSPTWCYKMITAFNKYIQYSHMKKNNWS